jgi:hypothetical protein
MPDKEIKNIRTIMYRGRLYFERDDLLELLREFAGSEETDTRERVYELVRRLAFLD